MPNGGGSLDPFDLSAERGLPPPWQWADIAPYRIMENDQPKAGGFKIREEGEQETIWVDMDYLEYEDWLASFEEWEAIYDYLVGEPVDTE